MRLNPGEGLWATCAAPRLGTIVAMLDQAALDLLARPLFARLSTNGADGYPHSVPIWFAIDVDEAGTASVWFISDRTARKTQNALVDPRAAVVIGGDPGDGGGYLLRGRISVEDDPRQQLTHRMIDRYEKGERNAALRAAWRDDDVVVLRLTVERATQVR